MKASGVKNFEFEEAMTSVRGLLNACRYPEALGAIQSLDPSSLSERRQRDHAMAKYYFRQLCYDQAEAILTGAIHETGPHVGLISDLAATQYLLGNFRAWSQTVQLLNSTLRSTWQDLTLEERFRTALQLIKFFEELGQVHAALKLSEEFSSKTYSAVPDQLQVLLRAQLLRVSAQFGESTSAVHTLYAELDLLKRKDPTLYYAIEIQHALIITECALGNFLHASNRIAELKTRAEFDEQDRLLCEFDFMTESLIARATRKTSPSHSFDNSIELEWLIDHGTSSYEKSVLRMARTQLPISNANSNREQSWDFNDDEKLNPAARLTVWFMRSHFWTGQLQREARTKFETLLSAQGSRDRAFWAKRFAQPLENLTPAAQMLRYDFQNRNLSSSIGTLDFNEAETLRLIFEALIKAPKTLPDALAVAVWGNVDPASQYNRLRVSCQRLNKMLQSVSGSERSIRFSKNEISLEITVSPLAKT